MIIGIITILAVIAQIIGLATGTATASQRLRAQWREWCSRSDSQLASQVVAADRSRPFSPAWSGWRSLRVIDTHMVSADCKTFVFADPDGTPMPSFVPGQFLMVGRVDEPGTAPVAARCYSLSDAPSPTHLQITVKRIEGGQVSAWLHDTISAGDSVQVRAPGGRFVLDIERTDLVVGIAAGVGITPMTSMAKYVTKMQPGRSVIVFLSARDAAHCPMVDELRALERSCPFFTLVVLQSRPEPGDHFDLKGRLSIDIISRVVGEPIGSYYLCGPPEFMTSLSDALIQWGVPKDSVSFESFGGPKPHTAVIEGEASAPIPVEFRRSGKKAAFSPADGNLLDAAEKAGVQMDADCRAGACGTCLKKLIQGKVQYDQAPSFGPIADDECLPCVAKPSEATILDA
ncbi:Flavohemoprotein [Rosistilla carotiformis]|uniref:Flavohemoprotein n=1 Tax=Rosistilla carotiformis TaxID=2528017 RepID=A0A518JTM6_9BACT|nr:2Fe-2S iron-sulfur cluster-binding protein [Rosistilla carotiformis]QDV68893.1 Flavohemoprotein [Rosistilla carotiformis]